LQFIGSLFVSNVAQATKSSKNNSSGTVKKTWGRRSTQS